MTANTNQEDAMIEQMKEDWDMIAVIAALAAAGVALIIFC